MDNIKDEKDKLLFQLVKEVGCELLAMQEISKDFQIKNSNQPNNYVTSADLYSEEMILNFIKLHYPDDSIISEEATEANANKNVEGDYIWHVDPLDGTVNFLRGYEYWCISVARVEVSTGKTVLAFVYCPPLDKGWGYLEEFGFSFTINRLNEIKAFKKASFQGKILGVGFSYDKQIRETYGMLLPTLLPDYDDIRHSGSTALNLCFLAEGRIDSFYDLESKSWDFMAGKAIAENSGNSVKATLNSPHNTYKIEGNFFLPQLGTGFSCCNFLYRKKAL